MSDNKKQINMFSQAVQLISLDCSSITGQNTTICHSISQSLHQSILNLKTVLPTFTSEFLLFKQQIMEMSYYIVNKLMTIIKGKCLEIIRLQQQLQKSQSLTNIMKKQVIQLKQMISEFMQSYNKEIQKKQIQIQNRQKEIYHQSKQIKDLKNVLSQNFHSPSRNICSKCEDQIAQTIISHNLYNQKEIKNIQNMEQKSDQVNLFKSYGQNEEILIQMSESIICDSKQYEKKMSLQIIQEEGSDINSLTDYLYSQRCSQNTEKYISSKQVSQVVKSTRSVNKQQNFDINKNSCKFKLNHNNKNLDHNNKQYFEYDYSNQLSTHQINAYEQQKSENQKTVKNTGSPSTNKISIISSLTPSVSNNIKSKDTFSSRLANKQNQSQIHQIERRNSEQLFDKSIYQNDGFRIERKVLGNNRDLQNIYNQTQGLAQSKDQNFVNISTNIQALHQQMSNSSSSSDIFHHLGDTDKININLPKKFDSPKNMSFVKTSSSRKQRQQKQERLKTQPSPRNKKFEVNKENINIQYHKKPVQMGRKIFTRKKTIMTHAKQSHTARLESKGYNNTSVKSNKNDKLIEIKYIQSPEKQKQKQKVEVKSSHVLKASSISPSLFSSTVQNKQESQFPNNYKANHKNNFMMYTSTPSPSSTTEVSNNISKINESTVNSHNLYYSTGKYQAQLVNNKNSSHLEQLMQGRNSFSLNKIRSHQSNNFSSNVNHLTESSVKLNDRKSLSKSKEKLKVTSKSFGNTYMNTNGDEKTKLKQQQEKNIKQKFLNQMNSNNFYSSNPFFKQKNLSVHIGTTTKSHFKSGLNQIKQSLKQFNQQVTSLFKILQEVFYDGRLSQTLTKQGQGKVVYDNGIIYEGNFNNNSGKKQGDGKYILNGICIYQGQFASQMMEGQGYLKYLKYLIPSSANVPKILQESSYFGRFKENKFDGMGTLFLSSKQKIVTKFSQGIPYGELTYYTQNDIQFGHWPLD